MFFSLSAFCDGAAYNTQHTTLKTLHIKFDINKPKKKADEDEIRLSSEQQSDSGGSVVKTAVI